MDGDEMRLDGNAAGGLLAEIFCFDMTTVQLRCGHCGATEQTGADLVYMNAPGMVIRCLHCEGVLIRVVHGGGRYRLDMQGVACLEIQEQRSPAPPS